MGQIRPCRRSARPGARAAPSTPWRRRWRRPSICRWRHRRLAFAIRAGRHTLLELGVLDVIRAIGLHAIRMRRRIADGEDSVGGRADGAAARGVPAADAAFWLGAAFPPPNVAGSADPVPLRCGVRRTEGGTGSLQDLGLRDQRGIYRACVRRIQGVCQPVVAELVDELDKCTVVWGVEIVIEALGRRESDAEHCGE